MFQVLDVSARTNRRLYGRRGTKADGDILHTTDGRNSLAYLTGGVLAEGRVASADTLIARDGTIYVLIPFDCFSYHLGQSSDDGVTNLNDKLNKRYVGIEIENYDRAGELCTPRQHEAAALVHRNKAGAHGFDLQAAYGHYQLARPMGRRSDPQGFMWGRFFFLVFNPTQEMLDHERSVA